MKHKQRILFYCTVALALTTIAGMIILIFSSKTWIDAVFDLVILCISAASILLAIYSELSSARESQRLTHVIKDINEIDNNLTSDMGIDGEMRKKLNHITETTDEILAILKTKGK